MVVPVTIEGVKVLGKIVPKKKLESIWNRLTERTFPRVIAYRLEDHEFDRILELRRCREDERREIQEWGKVLSTRGTDACVFNVNEFDDVDYVILVRKKPYHELEEILKHELWHISSGDL